MTSDARLTRPVAGWSLSLALLALVACGGDDRPDAAVDAGGGVDAANDAGGATDTGVSPTPDAEAVDAGLAVDSGGEVDAPAPTPDAGRPFEDPHGLDAPGAFTVSTSNAMVRRGSRTTPVTAYVPSGADTHPLIVFLPGFQLDSSMYVPYLERLASHGFIVVGANPPPGTVSVDHVAMRDDAIAVLNWATDDAPFSARVDTTRIGTTGHSLGGKLATMTAIADARVRAVFALDPVDGNPSPLLPGERPTINPAGTGTLAIPLGWVGETTNATGGVGGMPCAPAANNFMQFFAASTMSPWVAEWDFLGADHMDFVWDCRGSGFLNPCTACTAGTADPVQVRRFSLVLAVGFFRRHFLGDDAVEPWLRGANVPPGVNVRSRP